MSTVLRALNIKNPRLYMAILLGTGFGLSVYCYWLIDILPPTSRWIFLCTALAGLVTSVLFLFLIEWWVVPCLSALTQLQRWLLLGLSILTGAFLMFAGTNVWKSPERYLVFLLPNEQIKISVPLSQNLSNTSIAIQLFSTSIGDVSYNSIKYQGWQRKGSLLVLTDKENNSFEWTGKAGGQATIVFPTSAQGGMVQISTEEGEETINLSSRINGRYFYIHDFYTPFYASRTIVLLLGLLDFSAFCFLMELLILEKRNVILDYLDRSISILPAGEKDSARESKEKIVRRSAIALDWGIVIGTIAFAIFLRVFNLDRLSPLSDEYRHLLAAKAIANGSSLNTIYQRSLLIVTLPVALFFRVFGFKLWAARLSGVLFNSLAIIPLYLITKKINRPIAFLSCILFATNPWLIGVSRYVREYGYYPFYFYWIIYGMIVLYQNIPDDFLTGGWKKKLEAHTIFPAAVLLLPIIYMTLIDSDSTFKLISIAYGVFGLFVLSKIFVKSKAFAGFLTILAILFLGGLCLYSEKSGYISFHSIQSYWLRYFFSNPQQQWYFNRLAIIPIVGLACAIFLGIQIRKVNFIPSFFLALFSISLFFYMYFFNRYIQARYLLDVDFWFVPLVAIGFWCIWVFLNLIFSGKKLPVIFISLILLALSINGSQILLSTYYDNYGWMPITEEYHDDVRMTKSFLFDKVKLGDALISTYYGQYVTFEGNNTFDAIYFYNFQDKNPGGYVLSIVSQQNSGWIVLDDQIYDATKPLPLKTMMVNNKTITYMGEIANQFIWRWSTG
jgi:Dolichyl-phosphate-mannose-protein mannosyltransferase